MHLMNRKVSDYVGYHEVLITLFVMVVAVCTCIIESLIPSYIPLSLIHM